MDYQLAILVPPKVFPLRAAEACIASIRALEPAPARILVVDHAKGGLAGDALTRKQFASLGGHATEAGRAFYAKQPKTRHGHLVPKFAPLAALHGLAAEVRCSNDRALDNDAAWYASHQFKKYAILAAMDAGLDAAVLLKYPDTLSPQAPAGLLAYLEQNPDCSHTWPVQLLADRNAGDASRTRARQIRTPARTTDLDPTCKITERGFCLRLSALDRAAVEAIAHGEEPVRLLQLLLSHGPGQGVRTHDGRPVACLTAR